MRRNVKSSTRTSRITRFTMGGIALVIAVVTAVLICFRAESTCQDLRRTISAQERELKRLRDDYERESARWEEMTKPEHLERALVRHGLSMHYPKPEQVIRMRADGRPYPNQISVAKVEQRSALGATASLGRDARNVGPVNRSVRR